MGQSVAEIAKEITIAAIQNGIFKDKSSTSIGSVEEANKFNAEQIGKFFTTIAKHANDVMGGNF